MRHVFRYLGACFAASLVAGTMAVLATALPAAASTPTWTLAHADIYDSGYNQSSTSVLTVTDPNGGITTPVIQSSSPGTGFTCGAPETNTGTTASCTITAAPGPANGDDSGVIGANGTSNTLTVAETDSTGTYTTTETMIIYPAPICGAAPDAVGSYAGTTDTMYETTPPGTPVAEACYNGASGPASTLLTGIPSTGGTIFTGSNAIDAAGGTALTIMTGPGFNWTGSVGNGEADVDTGTAGLNKQAWSGATTTSAPPSTLTSASTVAAETSFKSSGDPMNTCPPQQAMIDAGMPYCFEEFETTGAGPSAAQVAVAYAGQNLPTSQTPTVALTQPDVPSTSSTPETITDASGACPADIGAGTTNFFGSAYSCWYGRAGDATPVTATIDGTTPVTVTPSVPANGDVSEGDYTVGSSSTITLVNVTGGQNTVTTSASSAGTATPPYSGLIGDGVSGTDIPVGTEVTGVTVNGNGTTTFTLSNNATATPAAETLTFYPVTLDPPQLNAQFTIPSGLSAGSHTLQVCEPTAPSNGNDWEFGVQWMTSQGSLQNGEVCGSTTFEVYTSSLSLTKSTTSTGYGAAGDTIPYSYLVTNTGTTTLSGVGVSDNLISDVSCPDSSLAPQASETCTATYTVTQGDVDNGSVTNTATARGTDPYSSTITSNSSSVTVDATGATSSLSLTKSTTSTGYGAAGDTIPYSYLVTNTGTTTESDITVSDNLVPDVSCPDSSLAPQASETCTGTYTVTQADVDAGSVTNTATASGNDGSVTSNPSSVTVDASDATSSLSLTKSTTSTGYGAAGDVIPYSYLVTNTGTTTESNIAVSDNLVPAVSCPDSSLAPQASETCTGSYTTTTADVDAGSVTNTATATGTAQGNAVSSAPSMVTVPEVIEFTSAASTTANEGQNSPFTVQATGGPGYPAISNASTLPAGMTFVDNGNGTATLGGAPYCGTQGTYDLGLTAQDGGVATPATQTLVLTVGTPAAANPSFLSPASATGTAGQPFSATVETDCVPLPTLASPSATALGLSLNPGSNPGTYTLEGTPSASEAGTHTISIKATAKIGTATVATTQSFMLTLDLAPTITSTRTTASATVGTAMTSFNITTKGFPTPTMGYTGALPAGVTLVDNGNGTATVSGTPDPGTGGVYNFSVTATNASGSATPENIALTVKQPPAFTSAPQSLTLTRGQPMSPVTFTASGYPPPTFKSTVLPAGLTMSSAGVLSGTPKAADTLKTYTMTVTATSAGAAPAATQTLTITLTAPPPPPS